jgi:two-component system, OmpR family, response regulator MtrA
VTNKIMVVEDDVALRTVLERLLTDFGFSVVAVGDGAHVVEQVRAEQPNVILMDIQLPNRNGIELVRDIRDIREFASLPIIMVTAKSEAEDMEEAFAAGADDWVEKSPWDQDKLMARIKNALRIQQRNNESLKPKEGDGLLRIGAVTLDVVGHEVRKNGERVALTPLEFKLLGTLAATPNKVFSREDLLKDVWDYGYQADTRLVNVHIQRLRSKIEDDPDNPTIVVTVRGVGYKAGQN